MNPEVLAAGEVDPSTVIAWIFLVVIGLFVVVALAKSVRVVPQQQAYVIERLGRYKKTLGAGLNFLVPIVDAVRAKVDLRERVVSFPPQPVITSDNLVVSIDTVLYYQVTNPTDATYSIENYLQGVEQLTVTTLRNVVGSLDLEKALTSREEINRVLRGVLDEATGKWGIKVTRVEIKAIEPPPSVRDSMEKQMRAERDRRAAILNAEGVKQSQILTAEGEQQAAVLRAQGDRQARVLQADGQAKAIKQVFEAIHEAKPDEKLLAYQYLQTLPQIANSPSNKIWMIPAELTRALDSFSGAIGDIGSALGGGGARTEPAERAAEPAPQKEAEDADERAIGASPHASPSAMGVASVPEKTLGHGDPVHTEPAPEAVDDKERP